MKKKMITGMIVFLFLSICNIFFSSFVHMILVKQSVNVQYVTFASSLNSIIQNKQHGVLFLCLEGFILLFVFIIAVNFKNSYKSDTTNITDMIQTPVVAGQNQYGSAHWLDNDEKDAVFDACILDNHMLYDLLKHGYDEDNFLEGRNDEYETEE